MPQATDVVEALKRELKARGLKYADIAQRIGMSEASVKRMFSERNFTLERLDEILKAAGIDFREIMRGFDREQHLIAQLTEAQEREIIDDPKLFTAAVSAMNLLSFDDMMRDYDFAPADLVAQLVKLDRMGLIELLPNNRFKLRIARTFAWIRGGPIMTAFRNNAGDFFDSDFTGEDELMMVLNARLSRASRATLIDRLKRLAREFSDQHVEDAHLPIGQRRPISLLLACRPWHPQLMRELAQEGAAKGLASRIIRR